MCSGLRAPQLRKRPRPYQISGVRAKIIIEVEAVEVKVVEVAEYFAKFLGNITFSASNGWLDKFKKRNNTKFLNICGESVCVNKDNCGDEKKLPTLLKNYEPNNFFNSDETAFFYIL